MTLLWPDALWLSPLAGAFVWIYFLLLRRRWKRALRYASLDLAREAMGPAQRARLHVPALLLLSALLLLMIAVARPSFVATFPSAVRTVVLAIDVSYSMTAADVGSTRLAAAQLAAKELVRELPPDVRVGILQFAAGADVVQVPTANRDQAMAAIDALELQSGSSPGMAVLGALLTLFPGADIARGYDVFGAGRIPPGFDRFVEASVHPRHVTAVPPGSNRSAAIVLLTDGEKTMGPDPVKAAQEAADRGVRVFSVGVGTARGARVDLPTSSIHVRLDEETLKPIAAVTSGKYLRLDTARESGKIGRKLGQEVMPNEADAELTAVFAAAALLLTLASGALSLLRSPCIT